jgi:hypothetical protein
METNLYGVQLGLKLLKFFGWPRYWIAPAIRQLK